MSGTLHRSPYTDEQAALLREQANLSARTRGNDPRDSPHRKAGDAFASTVAQVRDSVTPKYSYPELAEPLGMKPDTLRAKLARRGYEDPYPSQPPYTGEPYNVSNRTADHFSCQHEVDGELVYCERTRGPNGNTFVKTVRGKPVEHCRRHHLERLNRSRTARKDTTA